MLLSQLWYNLLHDDPTLLLISGTSYVRTFGFSELNFTSDPFFTFKLLNLGNFPRALLTYHSRHPSILHIVE
jgi:hypothetical protein